MKDDTDGSLQLAMFGSFRALFEKSASQSLDLSELAARVTKVGRVLIQGPAGIGKSHLVQTLSALLQDAGQESVLVALPRADELISSSDEPDEMLAARFLALFGNRLGHPTTFLLDDLDRLAPRTAEQVLRIVEELTSIHPEWSIVVADGMIRRSIREHRWLLVGWVDSSDGVATSWANLPFYLRIKGGGFAEPDDAIEAVFRAAGATESEISKLALLVFESRSVTESDTIKARNLDGELLRALTDFKVVDPVETGGLIFRHALFADYLVGRHLSARPDLWTKDGFRAATHDGSRLESLNLALGQLPADRVDEFVRHVDDWNYRASSALIAFDLENAQAISPQLRLAILTLLGIRRFSRLESVAGAVEDALSFHGGAYARRLLQAPSLHDVAAIAATEDILALGWPEFIACVNVPRDSAPEMAAYVLGFDSQDEILAWARSNMLACGPVVDALLPLLAPLIQEPDESVAWRAVHALASARDAATADLLLAVVSGTHPRWVMYGAIQSLLIVLDALAPEEMERRAELFIAAIGDLAIEPHFRRAVRRGLSLRGPSRKWCEIALRVIVETMERSQDLAEHDEWLRASASIRLRGHL